MLFSMFFENISAYVALLSPEGVVIEINRKALEDSFLTLDQVKGKNLADTKWWLYGNNARKRIVESIQRAANGESVVYEDRARIQESYKNLEVSIRPLLDDNGNVIFLIAEGKDITRRRKTEKELKISYRLLNSMPNFASIVGSDGRIQFVNKRIIDFLGFSREELIGFFLWDVGWFAHSIESAENIRRSVMAAVHGEISRVEISVCTKSGNKIIPLLFSSGPILDDEGELNGITVVGIITTELKEKEQLLLRERKTFSLIAEAAVYAGDITDLCNRILSGLIGITDFESGSVRLFDKKNKVLRVVSNCGMTSEMRKMFSDKSIFDPLCIASYTARTMEPIFAPDAREHEIYRLNTERFETFRCRSFICWPLMDAGRDFLGVIELIGSVAMEIPEQERFFFKTIATMFASVLKRKQADEQIEASLKEKEILLKEIHHRVKNNMQVVSSLLNLQSKEIDDKQITEMFKESRDRIRSMAFVHDQLYRSGNLSLINFNHYLKHLGKSLLRSYSIHPDKIFIHIDTEDVLLGIDKAVPCGLIINELVSNALKYAFPGNSKGGITINLDKNHAVNTLSVTISDNGIGFPLDLDFRKTRSLGLQLVTMLTDQIGGHIALNRDGGTTFHIRFST